MRFSHMHFSHAFSYAVFMQDAAATVLHVGGPTGARTGATADGDAVLAGVGLVRTLQRVLGVLVVPSLLGIV